MESIPPMFLSQMSLYKTSDNIPSRAYTSHTETRNKRIKPFSAEQRNRKISQELKRATQDRLLKEIARPKILIENITIDKPKHPSFYIEKARKDFETKSVNHSKVPSISTDRSKIFGPPLSREIAKTHTHCNSFSESNLVNCQAILFESQYRPKTSKAAQNTQNSCYPNWLVARNDFQSAYRKMSDYKNSDLEHIVSLHPSQRADDEKAALQAWISSTKFFGKLPKSVVYETCDKLFKENYQEGEWIFHKGDEADSMFIIFSGKVGIYLEDGSNIGIKSTKDAIGETALDTEMPRSAGVKAEEPTVIFKLKKTDYDSVILGIKKLEKHDNTKFLLSIRYFENWSFLKAQRLSNFLILKHYETDELLYDRGDPSNILYIIKEGKVEIQAFIDVEQKNCWPTGSQKWKIRQIKRKYIVTLNTLTYGQFFGEAELIEDYPRQTRAIAKEPTSCLIINRTEFFEVFSLKDIEHFTEMGGIYIPSNEKLQEKILKEINDRHQNEKALLDALKIDYSSVKGRDTSEKSRRLKGWLDNYKSRKTNEMKMFKQKVVKEVKKNIEIGSYSVLDGQPKEKDKKPVEFSI
ncbi:unnamed protein product [Blepharisma stoltei]|uniref:Cyclic nucleotide-binding domain-containing protein n=1 Tax=Blepharisma stoltei TaxID=1481888 RepID=A0AAU9KK12_9CILI|nr:unnamed protein product [Blepharisma stoltei]